MAGIYLHIPYCKQACYYCDFHFSTNLQNKGALVKSIVREIQLQRDFLSGETIHTIYLGGGTPSLLSIAELNEIFTTIRQYFPVDPHAEVTLEANPDDLSEQTLKDLSTTMVNRLSIGIQSFDNEVLKFLNRAHQADAAKNSVELARKAGFNNISIDLIYAIPGQHDNAWKKNIEQGLALQPQHISSYSLTIEEKTVFGKWASNGKLTETPDDDSALQLEMLIDMLEAKGFEHYEVSNFSLPGFQSKHNTSYWKQQKYLGVGPSAHSYNGIARQFNVRNNFEYIKTLSNNQVPATREVLTREDKINDYLLTTLRTSWGTDLAILKSAYSYDLIEIHQPYIARLLEQDLATVTGSVLLLTRKGRLLADKISSDLFATVE